MKHLTALLIKFIMVFIVLYVILGLIFGVSFGNVLLMSLFLVIIAYLLGDLGVLPMGGNLIATVADFGLAFLVIWLISVYVLGISIPLISGILSSAILIALGEWFFHKYLVDKVVKNNVRT